MARWISAAATDESTPPLRPHMTRSSPTFCRMCSTDSSINEAMFQSGSALQTANTKVAQDLHPLGRVDHFRMELDTEEGLC